MPFFISYIHFGSPCSLCWGTQPIFIFYLHERFGLYGCTRHAFKVSFTVESGNDWTFLWNYSPINPLARFSAYLKQKYPVTSPLPLGFSPHHRWLISQWRSSFLKVQASPLYHDKANLLLYKLLLNSSSHTHTNILLSSQGLGNSFLSLSCHQ